jgi:hypothetical protein
VNRRSLENLRPAKKGEVRNPWGIKGKDGEVKDIITECARKIAAERVKTESGASTTLLDAAVRKLVQQGLVHGDVQALATFLDLVRGHRLKADVALSGSLNVNASLSYAQLVLRESQAGE